MLLICWLICVTGCVKLLFNERNATSAGAGRGQRTAEGRPERAALCAALHEGTTEPFGPH